MSDTLHNLSSHHEPGRRSTAVENAVTAGRAAGATVLETAGAIVVVIPTGAATAPSTDDLIPIADAARIAATSVRVVKDAIRAGALAAVGRQRDRAVRRGDLDVWITGRSTKARVDPDDYAARIASWRRSRTG